MNRPGETHCVACGKRILVNGVRDDNHKCSERQQRRRKRRAERDAVGEYSRRLSDGFGLMNGE